MNLELRIEFFLYNFYGLITRILAYYYATFGFDGLSQVSNFWIQSISSGLNKHYFTSRADDFCIEDNSLTQFLGKNFLIDQVEEVDVNMSFSLDSDALPVGSTLMYAVCRKDEKRLRNSFRKRKKGKEVIGSKAPYNPLSRVGSFVGIKVNGKINNLYNVGKKNINYKMLFYTSLVNPRDWVLVGDELWILTNPNILVVKKNGDIQKVSNKLFSDQHSLRLHLNKQQIVMTSTGNDTIFLIDVITKEIVRKWSAVENGYNHVLGKEKIMLSYKDSDEDPQVPKGYNLLKISQLQVLRTPRQIFHPNSAIFDDKESSGEIIYFTAFGSKTVDDQGKIVNQNGSGGKVIAIKGNNELVDVITGLNNPHGLRNIGILEGKRIYMLTESSMGTINFYLEEEIYKWKILGKININKVPGVRFEPELPWIMDCAVNINKKTGDVIMSFYDGERLGMHILRLANKGKLLQRWFISTSESSSIQRVRVYS